MTVVTEKAMLAKLKISRWSASKHDRKISEDVAQQHGADPSMGRYSKRLIAKEKLDEIAAIATKARHHHYERTLPWLDDGARILPAASYFDYMQEQNAMRAEFEQAVAVFAQAYPTYVDEAKRQLNGLNAIVDDVQPDVVHVVECDTKIQHANSFEAGDRVRAMTMHGRGGTRFAPVFDWVAEQGIAPDCLIYFTDLCAFDFGPEPPYPVLWAATLDGRAPFGEVIRVVTD